jgi:rhodanese-related sulfurtransferase
MEKLSLITIEKLLEMRANTQRFTLIDVLSGESYKEGHIPGAINIHLENIESMAERYLDKKDTIVVYCGSYSCQASTKATRKLLEMGYKNTLDFKAGKRGWQHAGLGLEK